MVNLEIYFKKSLREIYLLFLIAISNYPLYGITIPEGIRGFTVTYGSLIESVLSKNLLKDILFPENQEEYDKFQRMILTSERLSEEGNNKDAISYLRRADFYLQDIGKTLSRSHGWSKTNYTLNEMKDWQEKAREAWAIHQFYQINLYLQYEYFYILNNTPSFEHFSHVQNVLNIYNNMDKSTSTYKQMENSTFPFYMKHLISSWESSNDLNNKFSLDSMINYISSQTDNLLSENGYWKRKFIKRSIILLAKYGYPEKAWIISNHLLANNTDALPAKVYLNLMIYNSKFSQAEKYILDIINTLKMTDLNSWGIYITYEKYYLNLLLIQNKYDTYDTHLEEFISQLKIFLQRIDLTTEIYEYIDYNLKDALLNRGLVKQYQNHDLKEITSLSIHSTELSTSNIQEKEQILKSYSDQNMNFNFVNQYSTFREFQKHIKNLQYAQAISAYLKLAKEFPESDMLPIAKLMNALYNKDFKTNKRDWYMLWMQSIYAQINTPEIIILLNYGIILDFNLDDEFFKFFTEQSQFLNGNEVNNILQALSTLSSWNKRILSSAAYFRPIDHKIRYLYLAKWGFSLSEENLSSAYEYTSTDRISKNLNCNNNNSCWILFPNNESVYSLIINDSKTSSLVKIHGLKDMNDQCMKFYSALEKNFSAPDLNSILLALSSHFNPIISQVQSIIKPGQLLNLHAYKLLQSFPIEGLLINGTNIHIGDEYKIVRVLPVDQAYVISCDTIPCKNTINEEKPIDNISSNNTGNHFLLGVGNIAPGFIIANPNIDELLDIEGLFSKKSLISETTNLPGNIIYSLNKQTNYIFHISGGWISNDDNNAVLVINEKKYGIPLDNFRYVDNIPYMVWSKNKGLNFLNGDFFTLENILTTFRYKKVNNIISSLAVSPKEFRQAFFYDLYFRIEQKKSDWTNAYFSALSRTKKGFPDSIWPHLMVIYEK